MTELLSNEVMCSVYKYIADNFQMWSTLTDFNIRDEEFLKKEADFMEVVSLFGSYGNVHLLMLLFIIAQLCASIMSPFFI